jgi:predicted amino acid-binding ACT domain protein
MYDDAMMVKIENMRVNEKESQKIYTTYEVLEKLAKTLDKADLNKEDKACLNLIKEPVNVLGKLNIQGEYFIFPMLHQKQETQGEIYFFKPKKTTTKNKNNLYVVLALNFPNINDIELHIHKQDKKIRMTINVGCEEIQKHISQYMPKLYDQIQNLGFQISQIEWGLIDQNKDKKLSSQSDTGHSFNHMDLKV